MATSDLGAGVTSRTEGYCEDAAPRQPQDRAHPADGPGAKRPTVLVADPPWRFRDSLPGRARGASKHYGCLSASDIVRFTLPPIGSDAVLFLWRVASMQQEALDVCRHWGFVVKTELVWIKETSSGKRHMGMGRILRAEHETCLVATRGKVAPDVRNVRSTFRAPVRSHSEKPEEFYAIVRELFPDYRKIELFARRTRPGWEQYGNQVGLLDEVAR